jgi:prepilin-type processing-associated H-X9-DG protein
VQGSKNGHIWRDLDDDGSELPDTYHQIKEGIERFFITDINNPASGSTGQSTLPVMWDGWGRKDGWVRGDGTVLSGLRAFNHIPGGANTLYMDGHVEFVRFGSRIPCADGPEGTPGATISIWMGIVGGGFG